MSLELVSLSIGIRVFLFMGKLIIKLQVEK